MKKIYIMFMLCLIGCQESIKKIDPLSFQNQWGVACYIYPKYPMDGCSYRAFFLPFKNEVDIKEVTDSSSIFNFEYRQGISFYTSNPIFLDQIRSTSIKRQVYIKGNIDHVVFWSFVKLKYSINTSHLKQIMSNDISSDTLSLKNLKVPVFYYKLNRDIKIDTAFTKMKYISPWNDPDYRFKRKHFYMPCFIFTRFL